MLSSGTDACRMGPEVGHYPLLGLDSDWGPVDVARYAAGMKKLIELERREDRRQSAGGVPAKDGATQPTGDLPNLKLVNIENGLLDRSLLTFVNAKGVPPHPLPPHRLTVRRSVLVKTEPEEAKGTWQPVGQGIVWKCSEGSITVAVDSELDADPSAVFWLEPTAEEATYNRMLAALRTLELVSSAGSSTLVDVCFGRTPPGPPLADWQDPVVWINEGLDASQKEAVTMALRSPDVALIHGPPGTGKTTAVIEYILQEVKRGSRVLACAASNIAVDNLVLRLAATSTTVVRLGHPARLLPQVLSCSLEAKIRKADNAKLAIDCAKEIQDITKRILQLKGKKNAATRRTLWAEVRELRKEKKKRENLAVQDVLREAQVVCCTLTGADVPLMEKQGFDVVVIDEAAQAVEPACWIALLRGERAVLAGDHLQLPATVLSNAAARGGLQQSLFARLAPRIVDGMELPGAAGGAAGATEALGPAREAAADAESSATDKAAADTKSRNPASLQPSRRSSDIPSTLLTVQYRMHEEIMAWSNTMLYGGRLAAAPAVAAHVLAELAGVSSVPGVTDVPCLLLDTAGTGAEEAQDPATCSSFNAIEARATMAHVRRLLAAGVSAQDIGVVTPYAAQVCRLRDARPEGIGAELEISTVDGFQGREKEAIVFSAVRTGTDLGFVTDTRRANVAVTRARRHFALVCDPDALRRDDFLASLVSHFEDCGVYEMAEQLLEQE